MNDFIDTAKKLGASQSVIDETYQVFAKTGIGPNDPEAIRILMTVLLEERNKASIEAVNTATQKASSELKAVVSRSLGIMKRNTDEQIKNMMDLADSKAIQLDAVARASGTDVAKTVSTDIASSVDQAIRTTVKTRYNVSIFGFLVVSLLMSVLGYYLGQIQMHDVDMSKASGIPLDNLTAWLSSFPPYDLLGAGVVGFLFVRIVCAYSVNSKAIRWLLALPEPRTSWR